MNNVYLINSSGIYESFSNISSKYSVEIKFDLENIDLNKDGGIAIVKLLNTAYNDGKTHIKDWVIVRQYPHSILLKGYDSDKNIKYIEITHKKKGVM